MSRPVYSLLSKEAAITTRGDQGITYSTRNHRIKEGDQERDKDSNWMMGQLINEKQRRKGPLAIKHNPIKSFNEPVSNEIGRDRERNEYSATWLYIG